MKLTDLKIRATTEISPGFVVLELAEPVEIKCSTPGCYEAHRTDVLLLDRTMNGVVPVDNVADARAHVASLNLGA